jgi:ribosomal protein L17
MCATFRIQITREGDRRIIWHFEVQTTKRKTFSIVRSIEKTLTVSEVSTNHNVAKTSEPLGHRAVF